MTSRPPFDTRPYMMKVSGQDYLKAAGRVAWFRYDWPDGEITTKLQEHAPDSYAVFSCFVSKGEGRGSASGWGSQSKSNFPAYFEKAETKAVARALAHLGYGEENDEGEDADDALAFSQAVHQPATRSDRAGRAQAPNVAPGASAPASARSGPDAPANRAVPAKAERMSDAMDRLSEPPDYGDDRADIDPAAEPEPRAVPQGQPGLGGFKVGDRPALPQQMDQIIKRLAHEGLDLDSGLVEDACIRIYNATPPFLSQSQAADFIHRLSESVQATVEEGMPPEPHPVMWVPNAVLLAAKIEGASSVEEAREWAELCKSNYRKLEDAKQIVALLAPALEKWGLKKDKAEA